MVCFCTLLSLAKDWSVHTTFFSRCCPVAASRDQVLRLAAPRDQVLLLAAPRDQVLLLAAPSDQVLLLAALSMNYVRRSSNAGTSLREWVLRIRLRPGVALKRRFPGAAPDLLNLPLAF